MDIERWQRLSPQLDVLLELDPPARAAQLQLIRQRDPALADELEALLALEDDDDGLLSAPLAEKPESHLRPGAMIGPYRLESLLGEGGMGMVWLATRADGLYQRRVALKLLRPGLADPNLRLRFTREREILARLEHPNIARLLDAGIDTHGQPYLALEYVEGIAITDYVARHGLSLPERLALFSQVCDAVSHAHANLIIHRDLKPSNILVTAAGEVRLLDFGIAKLLDDAEPVPLHPHTEVRAFTLHYAAPEQIRGELVSTRTDVYSLGVVLYELLTDTKPYRLRRRSDAEWEEAILAVDPLRPSLAVQRHQDGSPNQSPQARKRARGLRGDLDNIALKALAKVPEHRYASVEALALDLQRYEHGRPVLARPQSLGYRFGKYLRRHRWGIAAGSVGVLLLMLAVSASVWKSRQALREAERAQAMQDFVIGLFDNAGSAQRGDALDARELLVAGERRGDRELAGQPLTHAELLGVIARLHIGLGDYRQALALLEKQQALLETRNDVPPSLQLESIIQHGRVLRLLGRGRECEALLSAMPPRMLRLHQPAPGLMADFLAEDGRCLRAIGNIQSARERFQQSRQLRLQQQDHAGVAENLWDLAGLDQDQGNEGEALQGYLQALAYLQAHDLLRQPVAIDIRVSIALLQRYQGDTAAAIDSYRQALELTQEIHGPQHPNTARLRRQMAAIQVDQGRFREAERQFRLLHRLTLDELGSHHPDTAASWNSLGIIAWELGDQERALADLDRAVAIWRGPDLERPLSGGLYNRALVLHDVGREQDALAALREARRLRVKWYGASHPLVGEIDRMIGEVLAGEGKLDQATPYFMRAETLTRVGYGPEHPRSLFAALSLARQWGRLGQVDDALAKLDALARQPGGGSEIPKLRWSARAAADALRCKGAQATAARRDLDALIDELQREQPEGGVLPREVQQIRVHCR